MIGARAGGEVATTSAPNGFVTLVEGRTFCLSSASGDIVPGAAQGLFVLDTRVLSRWELHVAGAAIEPLSVDVREPHAADFAARTRPAPGRGDAELVVLRRRRIGRGMSERIEIVNHATTKADVTVELRCECDFAGIFEVKSGRLTPRPGTGATAGDGTVVFTAGATAPGTEVAVSAGGPGSDTGTVTEADADAAPAVLRWRRTLEPRERWEVCCDVTATFDGRRLVPRFGCGRRDEDAVPSRRLASWRATIPEVTSSDPALDAAVARSGADLGSLRIFDAEHPDVPILAAGVPWYLTLFGRDSLLTAWMTLLADPSLAVGVLDSLARLQGTDVDPRTEEEPGRILHEVRLDLGDGMAFAGGDVSYGSVDATPLFVMLLAEARRWGLDDASLRRLLPHADRALDWIERFGDRDGDGYVEYQRATPEGLANEGWKDSWDGIRFGDGAFPEPPIALCEVQAYVYGAYLARADLAEELGDVATRDRYRAKAATLRRRFDEDFWLEDRGWYALALDGRKRPVDALASNMGHCLWTGIVEPGRAERLAGLLLSPPLFSGWGVRTLASSMAAYNPVSYHNGSVWPHDNAIIAAGLARYGFAAHAARIIRAQLDAAARCGGRLPELFAGFDRAEFGAPAAYPSSCAPQAWAAAAPLLWLRVLLGLDLDAPSGELSVEPRLPDWLDELHLDGLIVAGQRLSVHVTGDGVGVEGAGPLRLRRSPTRT